MLNWITPDWPAPANIQAVSTLRGMNFATHLVGNDLAQVAQNRSALEKALGLNKKIHWLDQKHANTVLNFDEPVLERPADACYTTQTGTACAVLTADCLPVLLCDTKGAWVAAVHGGWRGLLSGVLLNTLAGAPKEAALIAWLGPAMSQAHYEVGPEVRAAFLEIEPVYEAAFKPIVSPESNQKFLLDLYQIARIQLQTKKVAVFGGNECTYLDSDRFYSFRGGDKIDRQVTMIWKV